MGQPCRVLAEAAAECCGEITDIDVGGNRITINNAATASGSVTLTFTHTLYGICNIAYPHVQGQDAT